MPKWIWKTTTTINDYAHFFKEINLTEKVNNANIKISAHNHFKLYINKTLVSGYVVPVSTVATKEKAYLEYDISKYLKLGTNLIEVIVLYFGDNGQNYKKAYPGLWLDLVINTKKDTIKIVSDNTWKVSKVTPYEVNMPFQQSRKITPVEKYNANDKFSYDKFTLASYSKLNELNPLLTKQLLNEGAIYEIITPKFLKYENGISVFDVGKIISGFVGFELKGEKNTKLTVRYSENLDEKGFVGHNVANEFSNNYKDIYIMNGSKLESHQFDFTYKAFRFFQVEGYFKAVNPSEIKALFAGTKLTTIKENKPTTNDPRVDILYDMFIQTQRNNTLNLLTDCPHREQAQYLGDSDIQLESVITNIKEAKDLIHKVLTDFMYEQFDDGSFPFVAPLNYVEPFTIKIPEYDLYYSEIMKKGYEIDFDKELLKRYLPTLEKSLKYTLTYKDKTNLFKKTPFWHISDWPYPTVNHDGNYLTTYNLLTLNSFKNMSYFLKELNLDNTFYINEANSLKEAIRKHLIKDGLLIDSLPGNTYHQGVNALGVLSGVFEDNEINRVVDFIESKGFGSSVILGRSTLRVMQQQNRMDFVYKYLFDFEKGWTPMIKKGNLTFFEGYDDIESHSHAWNGFPIRIIQDHLKIK